MGGLVSWTKEKKRSKTQNIKGGVRVAYILLSLTYVRLDFISMQVILHSHTWIGRLESRACCLYSRCYTRSVLLASSRAPGMTNLPAKTHLLFFTKPIYFLLLLKPTGYFKPESKTQILLQSWQSDFSLQGTCSTQSLTALAFMLFIYSIYSCSYEKTSLNYGESWPLKPAEIGKCWERLSFLILRACSGAPWMGCQDPSCKSEGRHSLGLSATSHFGALISSTLSPNLPAVTFCPWGDRWKGGREQACAKQKISFT